MLTKAEELEYIALLEQEQAARSRENLAEYAEMVLEVKPAKHHLVIIDALEQVERSELDVLIISAPPGSAKSFYASMAFPAWYLGKHPERCVIAASHTQELAERFGRRVRNIIGGAAHKRAFPECGLSADSTAAGRWETSKGGEYFAAGVGGSVTGRRADLCLTGKSIVLTDGGFKRIDNIDVSSSACYILAYEESTHCTVYRRVVANTRRRTGEYFRIHTAAGHVVEATGNHRIYVSGVWKEAASIVVGDILLRSLPEAAQGAGLRDGEESPQGKREVLLRPVVCNTREQCGARDGGTEGVQSVLKTNAVTGQEQGMFERMSCCASGRQGNKEQDCPASELRPMRGRIQTVQQCNKFSILLDGLQEQIALSTDVEIEQPELAGRFRPKQVSGRERAEVQESQEGIEGVGWPYLCSLQEHRDSSSAPCGHGQCEQHHNEPCDTLRTLLLGTSWGRSRETAQDVVSLVERVCEDTFVYDIEVESTHNFFADGILVHNCIIDDPVKSREDADSETIRQKQWDWWRDDMTTRLKPGAATVLIMTRWHEDDLAGRMIADLKSSGLRVKILSIPMEAKEDDPLGRQVGEPLWPEWFTEQMRDTAKREPRTWSALYQQEPRPIGGGEFKVEWLNYWQRQPASTNKVILVDPSSGKYRTRGDFTSMWVLGCGPDGNDYVIDGIRDRLNLTERTDALFKLVRRYKPAAVGYEQYGLQADIEHIKAEQEVQQYRFRIIELGGGIKKEDRIRRLIPIFQQGKLWMPKSMVRQMASGNQNDIMDDFRAEYLSFPVGAHDDAMDCLARSQEPEMRKYLTAPRQEERQPTIPAWEPMDSETAY